MGKNEKELGLAKQKALTVSIVAIHLDINRDIYLRQSFRDWGISKRMPKSGINQAIKFVTWHDNSEPVRCSSRSLLKH
jgi:hypothetical protein